MTAPTGGRPATRVVPVVCVLALVCTIAIIASPALRRQLDLSLTRQPDPYVEMYFADVAAARSCHSVHGATHLRVRVASHLTAPARLRYRARVVASGVRRDGQAVTGRVATTPGEASTFTTTLHVPRRAYSVRVALVGRPVQLIVHCAAPARGHR